MATQADRVNDHFARWTWVTQLPPWCSFPSSYTMHPFGPGVPRLWSTGTRGLTPCVVEESDWMKKGKDSTASGIRWSASGMTSDHRICFKTAP